MKINTIKITDKISYVPATEEPLSADVGIIEGENAVWFFDIGASDEVAEFIRNYDSGVNSKSEKRKKIAVISHFHTDHSANITKVGFDKIFLSKETLKYLDIIMKSGDQHDTQTPKISETDIDISKISQIVSEKIEIDDGVKIQISTIPSTHSKGSVYLKVDNYVFLGDSTFYGYKRGQKFYNAQLLQEEIKVLKDLEVDFCMLSHRKKLVKQKKAVLSLLEQIYETKKPNENEIAIF